MAAPALCCGAAPVLVPLPMTGTGRIQVLSGRAKRGDRARRAAEVDHRQRGAAEDRPPVSVLAPPLPARRRGASRHPRAPATARGAILHPVVVMAAGRCRMEGPMIALG